MTERALPRPRTARPRAAQAARATLLTATALLLAAGASAQTPECPAAGTRFKRVNAGFESVLTSEGRGDGRGGCHFRTPEGTVATFLLKAGDTPLDPVPRQGSGPCPAGGQAQYKIVLTEYSDPIAAGPDAAGRCLLKSSRFGDQWVHPGEFKLAAGGGAATPTAMDLGGTWRCSANGNIPIALLSFSGNRYQLRDSDARWNPKGGKLDGSGTIRPGAAGFEPLSGPMVSELGIKTAQYSAERGRRALYLSNKPSGLALLQCLPAS